MTDTTKAEGGPEMAVGEVSTELAPLRRHCRTSPARLRSGAHVLGAGVCASQPLSELGSRPRGAKVIDASRPDSSARRKAVRNVGSENSEESGGVSAPSRAACFWQAPVYTMPLIGLSKPGAIHRC
jgi:hypothetical protein